MATFHETNLKYQSYLANLDRNISIAIGTVDHLILDLQREQMKKRHVTSKGAPINPPYSPSYKKYKNKKYPSITNPNLYETGDFQNKFVMTANLQKYFIKSLNWKNAKLTARYEDLFGIELSNQPTAKQITSKAISTHLNNSVFK